MRLNISIFRLNVSKGINFTLMFYFSVNIFWVIGLLLYFHKIPQIVGNLTDLVLYLNHFFEILFIF